MLTDAGLIPIHELVGKTVNVWTGHRFAEAEGLNRGPCELAQITLESGLVINCDIRHKLKGPDLTWHDFADLAEGDLIALPEATALAFDPSQWKMGWPFLLGYWIGDGSMWDMERTTRAGKTYRAKRWSICGADKKREIVELAAEFLTAEGFNPKLRYMSKGRKQELVSCNLVSNAGTDKMLEHGFTYSNFLSKRVPETVWRMGEEDRRQFLYGYALSDGARLQSPRWHSPNLQLLSEVQILLSSVEVDSSLRTTQQGNGSLVTRCKRGGREYPFQRLEQDMRKSGETIKVANGDCDSIVAKKIFRDRGHCSQHSAHKIYNRYLPEVEEVYRYDRITKITLTGEVEDTYTMSVHDQLHQFVADGVVHKNTSADMLKVARQEIYRRNMREKYRMRATAPIYDEIRSSVPISLAVDYMEELDQAMSITPPGYPVGMQIEFSVGWNWGEKIEIGLFSREAAEAALAKLQEKSDA